MWKRLNRQLDRTGNIAPTESLMDDRDLNAATDLGNGDFSLSSRPAFGRKQTQDVLKGLPELPLALQVPKVHHTRSNPKNPTAPLIYSQPSPEQQKHYVARLDIPRASSVHPEDVSPPEPFRMNDSAQARSRRSSPNVSPLTESSSSQADRRLVDGKLNSNIPIPKKPQKISGAGSLFSSWRTKGTEVDSPVRESNSTSLTRWDDFSGEPTTSETGKPAQAIPGAALFDSEPSPVSRADDLGNSIAASGGNGPGRKRIPSKGAGELSGVREEWKGASGRHTIVNPLLDKPLPPGKSPTFPIGRQRQVEKSKEQMTRTGLALFPNAGRKAQHETRRPSNNENRQSGMNLGSGSVANNSRPRVLTSLASDRPAQNDHSDLAPSDTRSPLARNPSREEMKHQRPPTPPKNTSSMNINGASTESFDGRFRTTLQQLHLDDQPPSRFSCTTYATTAYSSSPTTPDLNSEIAVPGVPNPSPSVLSRKRPIPLAGAIGKITTTRKPTPSEVDVSSTPEMMIERQSKVLPRSPPEVEAVTRIASLQAKLDNLRRRRSNLQTVIHELTDVVQPSSIAYDIASRQEIKKTVDGLSKELAEVRKEEHETGLKLHRAWKRHDTDSSYQPGVLWVSRLAS